MKYKQVLASIEADRERERQAAAEESLRLLMDVLQADGKVAGANAPVPMLVNTSVVGPNRVQNAHTLEIQE